MSTFDLNAYRAAKADQDKPKVVKVGRRTFRLPASLPLSTLESFGEGQIKAGLTTLGGDEFAAALYDQGITADELSDMLAELYGATLGN